jgi:hypothetical protein
MDTGTLILVVLVLASGVFSAGCIAPNTPPVGIPAAVPVTPSTTPAGTQEARLPAALPSPPAPVTAVAPADNGTVEGTLPAPVATPEPAYFSAADVPDNPWIQSLVFTKSYFPFTVPDCAMRELFPEVAQQPGYGIGQPVPELVAFSPDRMSPFMQEYVYGGANPPAGTGCAAAPAGPVWNFVQIQGTIIPRNARPATYDTAIEVRSRGRIVAQFRFNATLTLEQPYTFERYAQVRRYGPV